MKVFLKKYINNLLTKFSFQGMVANYWAWAININAMKKSVSSLHIPGIESLTRLNIHNFYVLVCNIVVINYLSTFGLSKTLSRLYSRCLSTLNEVFNTLQLRKLLERKRIFRFEYLQALLTTLKVIKFFISHKRIVWAPNTIRLPYFRKYNNTRVVKK